MTVLYLVRHTRPDIPPGICYGQLDMGLAADFDTEAAEVLRWLPPIDMVVASPLQRAGLLADRIAARHGCPLYHDPRLMERHFGDWEGRNWSDIPRTEIEAWAADLLGHAPAEGETVLRLLERAGSFLLEAGRLPQQNIAVVSHSGTMRALLALHADIPMAKTLDWDIGYGAVVALPL